MRKPVGFRIFFTVYAALWWFVLLAIWCFLFGVLSHHMRVVLGEIGEVFPGLTECLAIPLIGGLGFGRHPGPTWVTYVVWTVLFAWPLANIAFVWWCKDPDRARWGVVYSSMSYALIFLVVMLAIGAGLGMPFFYL